MAWHGDKALAAMDIASAPIVGSAAFVDFAGDSAVLAALAPGSVTVAAAEGTAAPAKK